jgi:hypothetical protein
MRHTWRVARLRREQQNAPRHYVIVKGDSHYSIADGLKNGCRNYECENFPDSKIA